MKKDTIFFIGISIILVIALAFSVNETMELKNKNQKYNQKYELEPIPVEKYYKDVDLCYKYNATDIVEYYATNESGQIRFYSWIKRDERRFNYSMWEICKDENITINNLITLKRSGSCQSYPRVNLCTQGSDEFYLGKQGVTVQRNASCQNKENPILECFKTTEMYERGSRNIVFNRTFNIIKERAIDWK